MPSEPVHPEEASLDPVADLFYGGAIRRIRGFMLVIGLCGTVATLIAFGWRVALGVLAGCMVAWANFLWLKQGIKTIAEGATPGTDGNPRKATVAKSVLRYGLIGIAAYGIFLISRQSLYGFLGGLFVTVAAILCEAVYEAYAALRRGL